MKRKTALIHEAALMELQDSKPTPRGLVSRTWMHLSYGLLFFLPLHAGMTEAHVIRTVAGGGNGDGRAATHTGFGRPAGIALTADGSLHVSEQGTNRIRRIGPDGLVSTLAGISAPGASDAGGVASEASFEYPTGIAIDAQGNTYVADYSNHIVRKITPNGVISTFAGNRIRGVSGDGGPATKASLNGPNDIAIDTIGNIYIACDSKLRKVTPQGVISTFSAHGGKGLTIDAAGNLYETSGNQVLRINTLGVVSTIAGNTQGGFSGDQGPASTAMLNLPEGIHADRAGNILVADRGNQRVRKIDATGVITTIAGNGAGQFHGDGGQADEAGLPQPMDVLVGDSGVILVADGSNRIRSISPQGIITTMAGDGSYNYTGDGGQAMASGLGSPQDMAFDSLGNLYIADFNNHRVRRISVDGTISTVAGTSMPGFSGDGGPAVHADIRANGIALDAAGNLYIAEALNNRVRRVSTAGIISTVAGGGNPAQLGDGGLAVDASLLMPERVAIAGDGSIYIADTGHRRIRRVAPDGIIQTVAGTGEQGWTTNGDGGSALTASIGVPSGMVFDAAGNLYFADALTGSVRRVDTSGAISTVAGGRWPGDGMLATSTHLDWPTDVDFDEFGNLYIVEQFGQRITRVTPDGILHRIAGNGQYGYSGDGGDALDSQMAIPAALGFDMQGNLHVADVHNNRIRIVEKMAQPLLSVSNAQQLEGHSGARGVSFTVSLQSPIESDVSFSFYTHALAHVSRGASAGKDYASVSNGAGAIPAGHTNTTIVIKVLGDKQDERDESFGVRLGNATGAIASKIPGIGTIVDDDEPSTTTRPITQPAAQAARRSPAESICQDLARGMLLQEAQTALGLIPEPHGIAAILEYENRIRRFGCHQHPPANDQTSGRPVRFRPPSE